MAVIKVVTAKIAILVAWDFMCHMEIIELCLADNLKIRDSVNLFYITMWVFNETI